MDELLSDFLSDTAESLDIVEAGLMRLESQPGDTAILTAALRHLHTIKGGCGFLALPRLCTLTETAEGFLIAARADGAILTLADVNLTRAKELADELGAGLADSAAIMEIEADVLSPNALGAILTEQSIEKLRVPIIAGGANNQLATAVDGQRIHDRGIVYAPDYVINAGGIINVSVEFNPGGYDEKVSLTKIERIPQALKELWTIAKEERIPPSDAADRLAERIVADGRGAKKAESCGVPPKGKPRSGG